MCYSLIVTGDPAESHLYGVGLRPMGRTQVGLSTLKP